MREIGSEFWSVPICDSVNKIIPDKAVWYISGRSALYAIIRDIREKCTVKTVAMPSWCCDSMIIPFLKSGLEVKFYPVFRDGQNLCADIRHDCDITLLLDYFGHDCHFSTTSGIIIRDLTHNIFANCKKDADYYFGSLRKWCGIWTGGFAWKHEGSLINFNDDMNSADDVYIELRKRAMVDKERYINGVTDNKDYLCMFSQAEDMLAEFSVLPAAQRDIECARFLDVEYIKAKRRDNAQYLLNHIRDIAIFPRLATDDCPMFVPVLIKDRDRVRKILIDNHIYCPVHWPLTSFHHFDGIGKDLYEQEISLLCDQRYGEADMEKIVEILKAEL